MRIPFATRRNTSSDALTGDSPPQKPQPLTASVSFEHASVASLVSPSRLQRRPSMLPLPPCLAEGQRLIVKSDTPLVLRSTRKIGSPVTIIGVMEGGLPIRIARSCDTTPSGRVRALVQTEEEVPTIGWCTIKDDDDTYLEPAPIEV